ncbi:hypothetical protein [Serratia liquefaciens]|uniref:hypothetical protein n=1 Tax=Serratia liquefaciens TaxID=614 RepID=UPI003D00881E
MNKQRACLVEVGSSDKLKIGLYAPRYKPIVYLSDFNGCTARFSSGSSYADSYEIHGDPKDSEIFLKKDGVTHYSLFSEKDQTPKVNEQGAKYYGPAPLIVGQVLSLHPYPDEYPCIELRLDFFDI